ncbi:hypothetical protein BDB00DRAFT_942663 [Zychaea mexicana]|uniref:uncharacterized protein n=1 Tax=Zychaea mexicana TaxID=64656 RepID=UPI0022FE4DBC|nr:uncharacterized protein BDB00DRAFT_942663 [Zychaea mexicana]KAI9485127.1 hypothetical protein BDB00DRAFT_942663 [Zychaea mexicana]
MPDFTHVFPAETVTDIFSYLDQKECIECMEVCRRWYDLIPSFTTRVWHQLKVSSSSAGYDNDGNAISCCWLQSNIALLQCLGPHVKDVSICFQDTRSVLERLYTQRCEIKCLEINNHKPTLKRNKRPTTNDSIRLPVVITLFAPTLTQLSITSHPCDVSLTMLLDTLPALTHLSVTFNNSGYQNLSNTEVGQRKRRRSSFGVLSSAATLDNNNNNSNTHLVYLHLDNALNFDTRIQPILHRCPELQYLLITSDVSRFTLSNPPSNNIHVVFNLCPRVHHIIFNVHVDPEEKLAEKWLLQSQKNPNNSNATVDNGTDNDRKKKKIIIDRRRRQQQQLEQQQQPGTVRQLLYRGEDQEELNAIFPILEKSRLWLEDLHLESWEARLTGFLAMAHAHFYFPQLVSLEIFGIDMTGPEWVQILQSHPQIESLGMELWFDELEELDNVVEAISTLKRLQRIDLYWTNNYSGYRGTCSKLDLLHNTELQIVNLSGIPLSDQGLLHHSSHL